MTVAEIRQLLDKYKSQPLSPDELAQLQEAVASGAFEEEIKADILHTLYTGSAPEAEWPAGEKEAVLQQVLQATPLQPVRNAIRKRWMYAAAAVLAAGIITSGVFLMRRPATPAPVAATVKPNPLAPGGNKAMLILADNSTITLDSSSNGALAVQGNTQISNTNGALTYKGNGNNKQPLYNTVATPRGGQYQLTLADGSKIWLNAASSIRFPAAFTGKERLVEVTGEVYFEVSQNAHMPFHVKVNTPGMEEMTVTVLGTSFNVMAYADEQAIRTTLVDGAVQVARGNQQSLLQPGYQAAISSNGGTFETSMADVEQALAWKEGKFRFRNTNIRTIMRQLARWYDIEVAYDGNVSDIDLTGVISRREDAGALLKALETTQRVKFTVEGHTITARPVTPH
ncbi:ferric-dicitrate binding protein FerR, regulates iron transport through sigma-19 [Chitinophaga eiseniae]|uniref:Ferric-dicitrate binding protein FerR, regulates iron transport through sigma-19 n=1 Tax=Chitinophaga eiseniae TaxID=634771 RepID=A0A1T4SSG6_9BACT|nr:FecR domain-containing protein [Chitinophaga eiseniae]SKA31204.1 ferric-dicitrate binding protein FerR, regulates iron transport through sigma-19 [Chitinophaga eiseniae]